MEVWDHHTSYRQTVENSRRPRAPAVNPLYVSILWSPVDRDSWQSIDTTNLSAQQTYDTWQMKYIKRKFLQMSDFLL